MRPNNKFDWKQREIVVLMATGLVMWVFVGSSAWFQSFENEKFLVPSATGKEKGA